MALSNLGLIQMGGAMLRPGGSLGDGFLAYGNGIQADAHMRGQQAQTEAMQAKMRLLMESAQSERMAAQQEAAAEEHWQATARRLNQPQPLQAPQPAPVAPQGAQNGPMGAGAAALDPLAVMAEKQLQTPAQASVNPQGSDREVLMRELLLAGQRRKKSLEEMSAIVNAGQFGVAKPKDPIKVGQTETLLDPTTYQPLFKGEKPVDYNDLIVMVDGKPQINQLALEAKRKVAAAGATKIDLGLTKGQESADKKYGEDFVEFTTGGAADAEKNLAQLKAARSRLTKNKSITGPVSGSMPDAVNAFVNPEAVAVREQVEEVVQRNLRAVLGAQYTEKEGERLIARAFNPKLSPAENVKRLDRLIKQIEEATTAKRSAAEYFNRAGTLRGWQGKMPSISDFDLEGGGEEAPKAPATSGLPSANSIAEELARRRKAK